MQILFFPFPLSFDIFMIFFLRCNETSSLQLIAFSLSFFKSLFVSFFLSFSLAVFILCQSRLSLPLSLSLSLHLTHLLTLIFSLSHTHSHTMGEQRTKVFCANLLAVTMSITPKILQTMGGVYSW